MNLENKNMVFLENPFLMNWKRFFADSKNENAWEKKKRKSKEIKYNELQGEAPLDTYIKFVRNASQIFRIELEKMKRYSGKILVDEKDQVRGYNTTCMCGVTRLGDHMGLPIEVCKSKENGTLYFSGLAKCGSVWRCPVCSFRLVQERAKEVYRMSSEWLREDGNYCSFITFTGRHKKQDALKEVVDMLLSEFRKLQNTKKYKSLCEKYGVEGFVRTFEITYGKKNGWHPHFHFIFFHKADKDIAKEFHNELLGLWVKRKKVNATLSAQNAQFVYDGKAVSDYVTKWDMTKEMTRGNFKQETKQTNGEERYTPFSMLRKLALGLFETEKERVFYYQRFKEYLEATKGKHFIAISKKMKSFFRERFNEDMKSDKEILEDEVDNEVVFKMDCDFFDHYVKRFETAYILNAYENQGLDCVMEYFINIGYDVGYCDYRNMFYVSDIKAMSYESL